MSSFADFALLAAIPSYGGVELLRAQRVLPSGPGPLVHLALFGRSDAIARRVVEVASVATNVRHPAMERILEVGRFDGVVYGVADPTEGVDASALLAVDNTRRRAPPAELAVGIALSLARVLGALHESGVGGGSVFPTGLSPDTVFLEPGGAVRLRVLAAAAGDPAGPAPFRAPEGPSSRAADVYSLGRVLAALLAGDPAGLEAPRLSMGSPLLRLLPRMLDARPHERPELQEVSGRFDALLAELGTTPEQAVRQALAGTYRSLVVDSAAAGFLPAPRIIDEIRMRLGTVYSTTQRLYPIDGRSVPGRPLATLPPSTSDEGAAVFTDARQQARSSKRGKTAATILIADVQALVQGMTPRPTAPTKLMATADILKALPAPAPDADTGFEEPVNRTTLIDPAAFVPFAPPAGPTPLPGRVMPPPPPPPPPSAPVMARPTPPSPSELSAPVLRAPPPAPTASGPALGSRKSTVEGGIGQTTAERKRATPGTVSGSFRVAELPLLPEDRRAGPEDRRQSARAPAPDDSFQDTQRLEPSTRQAQRHNAPTTSDRAARPAASRPQPTPPSDLDAMFDDIFVDEAERPERTMIAPTALPSISQGETAKQRAHPRTEVANAPSRMGSSVPRGITGLQSNLRPQISDVDQSEDSDGEHTAIISANIPTLDVVAADPDDPEPLNDSGAFEMVGDDGRTFDNDHNPFNQSTRMVPGQALQVARPADEASEAPPASDQEGATESFTAERMRELMMSAEKSFRPGGPARPTTEAPRRISEPSAPIPRATKLSQAPTPGLHVLMVDAPDGATVAINGKVVGTGKVSVDVDGNARALVRVELAGFSPWSSVVQVQSRPRVRVRPTLKPKPAH